jgi:hypothetical protein
VLLIACANLASLVIARTESRRREFAVRASLGASRGRLLRQTMTESVLLSGAGGMLGLWLASAGVLALIRAYPTSVPRMREVAIDVPVLLFALGVSIGTGLICGLTPVTQGRLDGIVTALKGSGGRSSSGAARHHIRRVLVMVEVALAVMLVIGAGLLIRTVYNLTSVDAGFDRSRLLTFSMTLPMATSEPDTRAQAYQRVLDRLRAVPGVQRATVMSGLPPNRSQARSAPVSRTTPPPTEDPLKSSTTTNSSWATISRRWASRSSPAAASNGPISRRRARWSSSMKHWRTGSGRDGTQLGSVCGQT